MAQRVPDRAVGAGARGVKVLVIEAPAVLDQAQRRPGLVSIELEQRPVYDGLPDSELA
jgi:hypothetical protein